MICKSHKRSAVGLFSCLETLVYDLFWREELLAQIIVRSSGGSWRIERKRISYSVQ